MHPVVIRQSAAIPYRWSGDSLDIMIVSTSDRRRWTTPKGRLEPHLSAKESAVQEAYEEAGVLGFIAGGSLGSFLYEKRGLRHVDVYPMLVTRVLGDWPERFRRTRLWSPLEEAVQRVCFAGLRACIERLPDAIPVPAAHAA